MLCPSCQSENDDAAEVCFNCRAVLTAVTRGTLIASRYRILAPLGRGGMGAVYRARDEVLDEEVALKILRPEVAGTPEMAARFRSEIKLARKVSHWNVCRIHEYGEEGGLQYISMELISGATLKDRLRSGPLPSDQAFDVAIQIAEGLAAIHKVGIIHRDLKSPNVMIDGQGTAKVMDFGIAKPASAGTDGASTGYVLGSPEYMSPEQARGRRADFRSDLYSLGIVVFEAFTGRVPFRGATPVETLMMHVEAPPPLDDPALALPPAVLPVLRSALAKDPAARFPDAVSMAEALRAARLGPVAGADASASRTEVVHTRRLPVAERRRRSAVAIASAALVAVVVVAAALLTRRAPESPLVPSAVPPATTSPSATAVAAATPALPYTLAPDTTVATPAARLPESAPTTLRASPVPGPPSPAGVSTPRATSPATTASALPSPTTAPPTPAAVPSTAPPSPRETTVVPAASAPPPATPAPPIQGWLLVLPKTWATVMVDGKLIGTTPMPKFPLPPGSHSVVLTTRGYKPITQRVEIRPGETTTLRVDFTTDGDRR